MPDENNSWILLCTNFDFDLGTFATASFLLFKTHFFDHSLLVAMADVANAANAAPMDAPWDTPDPLTSVQQLQGLVGHGFNVGHDSTGDLQALIQSALGGIRKEIDLHMDLLEVEHVEYKTDHLHQRKMVRFWKCSKVTLHSSKFYTPGDAEQDVDQIYYQWTKMKNLPGWWVKKIWLSHDGWLLVAKKEEFNLLIHDGTTSVDQRNLVEATLSSEGSMENQRQNLGATMARQALQHFLHLPEGVLTTRERSRSPRGSVEAAVTITGLDDPPTANSNAEAEMPQAM